MHSSSPLQLKLKNHWHFTREKQNIKARNCLLIQAQTLLQNLFRNAQGLLVKCHSILAHETSLIPNLKFKRKKSVNNNFVDVTHQHCYKTKNFWGDFVFNVLLPLRLIENWIILWTDKVDFHLDCSENTHNWRIWEPKNSHSILQILL